MIRISYFHQSADLYGSDRTLLDLVSGLPAHDVEPIVFLPSEGPLAERLRNAGIETHVVALARLERASMTAAGVLRLARGLLSPGHAIDRALAGRPVDLVHSNTLAVLGGWRWAARARVPHVWHVHEIIERPRPAAALLRRLPRLASRGVICNSAATRSWMLGGAGARDDGDARLRVVLPGVRPPERPPAADRVAALRRRMLPSGEGLVVGLVGRINRWKGHALLIEAVEILSRSTSRRIAIAFVGDGARGQEHHVRAIEERIARSCARDRIRLLGFESDVWPVWEAIDIACVPSTEPEPFGLVAVEAMIAGRPVVAARHGGLPEVVQDGVTGLLFEPGDARDLARALGRLLDDDALRESLARNARAHGRTRFGVEEMRTRILSCYRAFVPGIAWPGAAAR